MPDDEAWDGAYEGTDVGWTLLLRALRFCLERHLGTKRRTIQRHGYVPSETSRPRSNR